MRKLFKAIGILGVGILVSAAACGAAQANTVTLNCAAFPVSFTGGNGGPTTVTCPAFTSGGTLTAASLELTGDYQFGGGAGTDVKFTYAVNNPAGVTWADAAPSGNVTGNFNSIVVVDIIDAATAGVTNANFANPFGVDITSAVQSGTVDHSAGGVQITYTFQPTTVPEPITLSLFGAGLAGAAALRRRKKKVD